MNYSRIAERVSLAAGSPITSITAAALVVVWAAIGPLFHFSEAWQLVINTGTTVVTFLMVFLIQATQNRETKALHLKLDELIRVGKARNTLIGVEKLTDSQLRDLELEFERIRNTP